MGNSIVYLKSMGWQCFYFIKFFFSFFFIILTFIILTNLLLLSLFNDFPRVHRFASLGTNVKYIFPLSLSHFHTFSFYLLLDYGPRISGLGPRSPVFFTFLNKKVIINPVLYTILYIFNVTQK